MTHDTDRDFHQLTGAFDRPVAPSPAFAERLKQQIAQSGAEKGAPTVQTSVPEMPRLLATRSTNAHVIAMPDPGHRITRVLEATAAAILILALLGAGFFINRNGNDLDDNPLRLAAVTGTTTPEPAAPEPRTPQSVVLNSDRAYQPDPSFNATHYRLAETSVPMAMSEEQSRVIAGDYMVQTGWFQKGSSEPASMELRVTSLSTDEVVWQESGGWGARISVFDNAVYAARISDDSIQLVARSLQSGEPVFASPEPMPLDYPGDLPVSWTTFGPVTDGDQVYLSNATGAVQAVDAKTGRIIWTLDGEEYQKGPKPVLPGGSMVVDNTYLWVVTGRNEIRQVGKISGDVIQMVSGYGASPTGIRLYHSGTQLIARAIDDDADILSQPTVTPNQPEMVQELVFGIDPLSAHANWVTLFAAIPGNIAVAPDRIYVPTRQSANDPIDIHMLNPVDGAMNNLPALSASDMVSITATGTQGNTLVIQDIPMGVRDRQHTGSVRVGEVVDNQFVPRFEEGNIQPGTGVVSPVPATIADGRAWFYANGGTLYTVQPVTPESATPAPTDPGRTNAYPAGFNPKTAQVAEPLGETETDFDTETGIAVGDVLVLIGTPSGADPVNAPFDTRLIGIDLVTGNQIWSQNRGITNTPVAGNNTFFVTQLSGNSAEKADVELSAISPTTGQTIWTHHLFSIGESELTSIDNLRPYLYPTPMAIGGSVYIANAWGEITALDAQSGTVQWQNGDAPIAVQLQSNKRGGSLVGDNEYLYVFDGDKTVSKLDRQTGRGLESWSYDMPPVRTSMRFTSLHLQKDVLIMDTLSLAGDPYSSDQLQAISTASGDVMWSINNVFRNSPIVLTNDILGFATNPDLDGTPSQNGNMEIMFYDLRSGDLVSQYGPANSTFASLSASGSVVCIHEDTGTVSCADFADPDPALRGVDIGAPYTATNPPSPILFWQDSAIVLGHDGGPYIIRSAGITSDATPVASSQAPSRGGTFGTTADMDATWPDAALPTGPLAPTWGHVIAAPKWVMPYGDIVAALGTSELVVLDASTGEELWTKPVGDVFADRINPGTRSTEMILAQSNYSMPSPWIDNNTLYVATSSELAGFDLMTGDEVFRAAHDTNTRPGLELPSYQLPLSLVIDDGTAYVTSTRIQNTYSIAAIDLSTGEIRWTITDDYVLATALMPVSDGHLVLSTKTSDVDYLVALDTADGSVAWTTKSAIGSDSSKTIDPVILFIADGTVIETRADSGAIQTGTPESENALRVATYDLETGDVIWTSRSDDPAWGLAPDAVSTCSFFPRTSNDRIVIPCGTDDTLSTFNAFDIRGDGTPHALPEWDATGQFNSGILAGNTEWIVGIDGTILRRQLDSGETTEIGTMGDNICTTRSLPTPDGFVCVTTDNLGTYTIQAFGPATDATPAP